MEGDIADRFVTVEYKTYANRSVKREIRRRARSAEDAMSPAASTTSCWTSRSPRWRRTDTYPTSTR